MHRSGTQLLIAGGIVVVVAVGISSAAVRASGSSSHGASRTGSSTGTPSAIPSTSVSTSVPTSPFGSAATPSDTSAPSSSTPVPTPSSPASTTPVGPGSGSAAAAMPPVTYVVKTGDNLYDIARWFHLHGYGALYEANRAVLGDNPSLIFPGQRITISGGVMTLSQP